MIATHLERLYLSNNYPPDHLIALAQAEDAAELGAAWKATARRAVAQGRWDKVAAARKWALHYHFRRRACEARWRLYVPRRAA